MQHIDCNAVPRGGRVTVSMSELWRSVDAKKIRKNRKANSSIKVSESQIQEQLVQVLDFNNLLYTHIANERQASAKYGAILKRRGVKKGVPDIFIFQRPPNFMHLGGCAIELKSQNGKASKSQDAWVDALKTNGYAARICYGLDDALTFLRELGYIKRT